MEIEARNEGGGVRENLLGGRGEVCVYMRLRERERKMTRTGSGGWGQEVQRSTEER